MEQVDENTEKMHKSERKYGKFGRSVQLPENIYKDRITATISQGIIKVKIPKK